MGGKSPDSGQGLNDWILQTLACDSKLTFVEPFGGMMGIGLNVPRDMAVIYNDADGAIVSWWMCIQDGFARDILEDMLKKTPFRAREVRDQAYNILKSKKYKKASIDVDVAWAVSVLLSMNVVPSLRGSFGLVWGNSKPNSQLPTNLDGLTDRLKTIQLDHTDALKLLETCKTKKNLLIYCDPPYPNTYGYRHDIDQRRFNKLLLEQSSKVAVSGYDGDRPELEKEGWMKHTLTHAVTLGTTHSSKKVDALWLNYDPGNRLF